MWEKEMREEGGGGETERAGERRGRQGRRKLRRKGYGEDEHHETTQDLRNFFRGSIRVSKNTLGGESRGGR